MEHIHVTFVVLKAARYPRLDSKHGLLPRDRQLSVWYSLHVVTAAVDIIPN